MADENYYLENFISKKIFTNIDSLSINNYEEKTNYSQRKKLFVFITYLFVNPYHPFQNF